VKIRRIRGAVGRQFQQPASGGDVIGMELAIMAEMFHVGGAVENRVQAVRQALIGWGGKAKTILAQIAR